MDGLETGFHTPLSMEQSIASEETTGAGRPHATDERVINARTSMLDHLVHPHIFDRILSFSSTDTLARFLRTSKHTADLAARLLYHHVEVDGFDERTWPFLGWNIGSAGTSIGVYQGFNTKSRLLRHLEILTVKPHDCGIGTCGFAHEVEQVRPPALRLYRQLLVPVPLSTVLEILDRYRWPCRTPIAPGLQVAHISVPDSMAGYSPASAFYLSTQNNIEETCTVQIGITDTGFINHLPAGLARQQKAIASGSLPKDRHLTMFHLPNHDGRYHPGMAIRQGDWRSLGSLDVSFATWLAVTSTLIRLSSTRFTLVGCEIFHPAWVNHSDGKEKCGSEAGSVSAALLASLTSSSARSLHPAFMSSLSLNNDVPDPASRVSFITLADYLLSSDGQEVVGREACLRYLADIRPVDAPSA